MQGYYARQYASEHVWAHRSCYADRPQYRAFDWEAQGASMKAMSLSKFDCVLLKGLLQAKGVQSTWDHLGNISAAVDILKKLKKRVASVMKTAYQGTTHTAPKTNHLVPRVAKKVHDKRLHVYTEDRIGNMKVKSVPNILPIGEAKLKSSLLATFNHKICAMAEGQQYVSDDLEEPDKLPQIALAVNPDNGNDPDEIAVDSSVE